MRIRCLALCFAAAFAATAQNYTGPLPPHPDLPYLKHAENPGAHRDAGGQRGKRQKGRDVTYVNRRRGLERQNTTGIADPLLQTDKVVAAKLALYKLESRNGRREITFSPKKQPKAIRVELTRLNGDKLYRLEVDESLEPGEYALSAEGSNQVFCFQVY